VNDLELILRLHRGDWPCGARENVAVALDGDPFAGNAEMLEQSRYRKVFRDFAVFSIDDDSHEHRGLLLPTL
jgi:hypothetical protein